MEPRIDLSKAPPAILKAMRGLEAAVYASGLEPALVDLVKLRASQINGCAYCMDMHAKDLRARGEKQERLDVLSAWREAPFYSDRERAALAWTEVVTLIAQNHVTDDFYNEARRHFSDDELANLTLAIVAINGWNRFGVAFRFVPGTYQSTVKQEKSQSA
ncbi:MAG: carboxymuconolactone decarboxylase family protein [Candidatus Acidiferrales bacterium]